MITLSGWSIKPPSTLTRFIFLLFLSGALMIMDHRGHHLEKIRSGLNIIFYPVQVVAALPVRAGDFIIDFFHGSNELRREYGQLHQENLLLQGKLEKYEALEADNAHLRELLNAAPRVADRAIVAEVLEVSPEPFTRKIVITKGARDGVYNGQPVIDAYGIIGQVTEVNAYTSKATLITDPSHAIPVQSTRNGLRALVFGTGSQDYVEVPYLTAASDIQEGDELVSSGLGGTFPAGYPVGKVVRIVNDPNESFLKILVKPAAHLNHNSEVMLIWPELKSASINAEKLKSGGRQK